MGTSQTGETNSNATFCSVVHSPSGDPVAVLPVVTVVENQTLRGLCIPDKNTSRGAPTLELVHIYVHQQY